MYETIGILIVIVVAMYFLMIRPARKQQQKQQAIMNALEVGSRVMLGSGIYGTIRHLGEKQAVIEISPGVDLTILRAAIRGAVTPEEEEFEYANENDITPPDGTMDAYEADLASPFAPDADHPAGLQPTGQPEQADQVPAAQVPAEPAADHDESAQPDSGPGPATAAEEPEQTDKK